MRGKKGFERMNEGSKSSVELLSEWKGGLFFKYDETSLQDTKERKRGSFWLARALSKI
jgi:hypothetical protein